MFSCVFILWEVAQANMSTRTDPHLHARVHIRAHAFAQATKSLPLYVCVGPCSSQSHIDNHVFSRCGDMEKEGAARTGRGNRPSGPGS